MGAELVLLGASFRHGVGVFWCLTLTLVPAASQGFLVPSIPAYRLPGPCPMRVALSKFKFVRLFPAVGIIK